MTCNRIQEELLHLIGKELPPEIRKHLQECEKCERKNRIFQATEESLDNLGDSIGLMLSPCHRRRFRQSGDVHFGAVFLVI